MVGGCHRVLLLLVLLILEVLHVNNLILMVKMILECEVLVIGVAL